MTPRAEVAIPKLGAAGAARGLGGSGVTLFALGVLLAGSGATAARIEMGGLMVHPMLILVALALVVHSFPRLKQFPPQVARGLIAFNLVFGIAVLFDPLLPWGLLLKVVSISATILVTSLLVRSDRDFRAGIYGMMLGVGAIGLLGVFQGEVGAETFNPMGDAGNKNSFSLFALPTLLLVGYLLIQPGVTSIKRALLGAGALVITLPVFLSANRSGWLGVVVVVIGLVMQSSGRRAGAFVWLAAVSFGTWILLTNIDIGVFERRMDQTLQGYSSDDLRQTLLKQCFLVGVDHPFLGMGPVSLSYELARRIPGYDAEFVGPHNALTYLFGAGGLGLVLAWAATGRSLARLGQVLVLRKGSLGLMHLLLAVWLVRGLFTDEILYSPSFGMAFGMVVGLCRLRAPAEAGSIEIPAPSPHVPTVAH